MNIFFRYINRLQDFISVLLVAFLLCAFIGCSNMGGKRDANCDNVLLESFVGSLRDSMMTAPHATIEIYGKARENTTDSISSYKLLLEISQCYLWAGETDNVLMTLEKVIDFCEHETPTPCLLLLQADAYFKYGLILSEISEYERAIAYAHKAFETMMKSGNRKLMMNIYFLFAESYHRKGDHPNASHFYHRALFAADSLDMGIEKRFLILQTIANLYRDVDNFDMAEYHYQQAEKNWDDVSDASKHTFYNSRGVYYMNTNDYPKALTYHKLFFQTLPYPHPYYCAIGTSNIGEMFLRMEQPDSARRYIDMAVKYIGQLDNIHGLEFHIDGLSAMLAMQESKLGEAEKQLSKPFNAALIEPYIINLRYQLLEDMYAQKNDFKNAYNYRLKVDAYNDSMRNTKIRNNIAEMEMRYRQDTTLLRKDLRIALVEGRASQWQNIALTSLLSLVLLAAITAAFIFRARQKREQKYREQVATVTGLRMEIVRNRLSPHFVFNALNVMMPSLGRHSELEQHFRLLSQLLKSNLQASEKIATTMEEEIELVKNYLQLQTLNKSRHIAVNWRIADDVPKDAQIPSMSIQIPVENAVKYAFAPEQDDARIDVVITRQAETLHIIIDDNGAGYQPDAGAFGERGTGSGLKMLQRTTNLLNTRNHHQIKFSIENRKSTGEGCGTRVSIVVPMDYQFVMN